MTETEAGEGGGKGSGSPVPGTESPRAVVGIGASAGGLAALEQFFSHLPPDTGMTFIVVIHMDPTGISLLPEILQRFTAMPVVQIRDRMQFRPNSVYVIPPGFYLSIADSTLFLYQIPMTRPRPWMTIDRFFRDLAETQDSRAVAIILSGTDHDGTLGIRSMKENLGTVMVQEPRSAEFSGMPESAIATGLVDYIAPAGDLPRLLTGYGEFIGKIPIAKMPTPEVNQPALFHIFSL
ncbi:MAG TPA: chemotaxis protein CheB, partial [Methanomicrobiales archaeon]|nr:chemotaxis protein CheB [Methanomicrobiales archaeon]